MKMRIRFIVPSDSPGQQIAGSPLQVYNCAVRLSDGPCPSVAIVCSNGWGQQIPLHGDQGTLLKGQDGTGMDAFSEILSGVKLNGAVFFTAEFSAPWGFWAPASKVMAAKMAPAAEHMVLYHLLIEGSAVVQLADGQCLDLLPGDV